MQSDALTISPDQSLEAYERIQTQRTTLLDREVAWLRTLGGRGRGPGNCLPIVATDVVPLACAAARTAGLPCVCVSNFTWVDIFANGETPEIFKSEAFLKNLRAATKDDGVAIMNVAPVVGSVRRRMTEAALKYWRDVKFVPMHPVQGGQYYVIFKT